MRGKKNSACAVVPVLERQAGQRRGCGCADRAYGYLPHLLRSGRREKSREYVAADRPVAGTAARKSERHEPGAEEAGRDQRTDVAVTFGFEDESGILKKRPAFGYVEDRRLFFLMSS